MGHPIAERLMALGLPERRAEHFGFALAVIVTTVLSLIAGELVPKQIALRKAEPIAIAAARPMALLAKLTAPVVWMLDRTSQFILRMIGIAPASAPHVTEEELHLIFAEATRSGVLEEDERAFMTGIMRLGDRPVRELMTPRPELDWVDRRASEADIRAVIKQTPHSLLPVCDGSPDHVIGVVKVREVLAALVAGRKISLPRLLHKPVIIPDQVDAMDALRMLQKGDVALALVHDEYGQLEGIVTPADLLSAMAGHFVSHGDAGDRPMVAEQEDGALMVAGALPADVLADRLGLELPEDREYGTAAGYALSVLKHLPQPGAVFVDQGWHFEVAQLDGRRIESLLVRQDQPEELG